MRITVTVRGDLEEYLTEQSTKTGLSASMIMYNLAIQGWEYKRSIDAIAKLGSMAMKETESKA
jgi:hypothetical protein